MMWDPEFAANTPEAENMHEWQDAVHLVCGRAEQGKKPLDKAGLFFYRLSNFKWKVISDWLIEPRADTFIFGIIFLIPVCPKCADPNDKHKIRRKSRGRTESKPTAFFIFKSGAPIKLRKVK